MEIKSLVIGLNSRMEGTKDRSNKPENGKMEMTPSEQQRENRLENKQTN